MNRSFVGLCAALCVAPFAAPIAASAQNNQLSNQTVVIDSISADEMISALGVLGLDAELAEESQNGTKHIKATNGRGVAYVALRDCDGPGAAARCSLAQPYGYFPGDGVTLAQVNEFNLGRSAISVAGLLPNGNGILGTKIYLGQGVSAAHLGFSLALFFRDIDTLVKAIQPGALATVSYKPARSSAPMLNGLAVISGEKALNPVGPNAPGLATDQIRALLDEGAKIKN